MTTTLVEYIYLLSKKEKMEKNFWHSVSSPLPPPRPGELNVWNEFLQSFNVPEMHQLGRFNKHKKHSLPFQDRQQGNAKIKSYSICSEKKGLNSNSNSTKTTFTKFMSRRRREKQISRGKIFSHFRNNKKSWVNGAITRIFPLFCSFGVWHQKDVIFEICHHRKSVALLLLSKR